MRRTALLLAFALTLPALAQTSETISGMRWREIGPFRGGRSLAVSGSVQRPQEYYFGATGGGVWKTTDGGENWACVSDGFLGSSSVGAVAVAPSSPDVVYAGTGERDIRGDISEGDGLYRTGDGGKTWRHVGLGSTQTIAAIVVHPKDPNTLWVAALGHVYGPHPDRGVYKSTDGGGTWRLVLPGTDRAGAVDLALDPANPDVLLAATWQAWRTPFTMNSGGPGSGMWKSTDGGETWTEITRRPGLPTGTVGKVGVAISPADPNRYWAQVEAEDGGLFRSDDAGATWTRVNDDRRWRQRAWYYTHVVADPKDRDGVWALNVGMGRSRDGGKTFTAVGSPHSDHHELWIAPDNPERVIVANDGGGAVSTDGGRKWTDQDFPTAQIYHVTADDHFPYRLLGAQQDNSTVRILSRTFEAGIGFDSWTSTAGGESGYVAAQPGNPDLVFGGSYGGDLSWFDHRTGISRQVDPWPDNPMGHPAADLEERFQWTFPIVFSPHDPNTLYVTSQHVLRSRDRGQSWIRISPDLTRNDKRTMGSSGGPITKDNTSVEYYGTVFTFAESPRRKGLLWTGSDDGLVHLSPDGGRTWRNVTPSDMPERALCSMIEPSPHDPNVAYLAVDNHENDDLKPYAYVTRNAGRTWTRIAGDLPVGHFVRVVREDPTRRGLLYLGTEKGAWVSLNDGQTWSPLGAGLPVTPVHDLVVKSGDLAAATHGRGFWTLDDLTPMRALAADGTRSVRLYVPPVSPRVRYGPVGGAGEGKNPPSGIPVSYFLPQKAKEVTVELRDAAGRVVHTTSGPVEPGYARVHLWPQIPSYRTAPGMIFWAGGPRPILLPPGQYTVALNVDGVRRSAPHRWTPDPRTGASEADLQEQVRFAREVSARVNEANFAVVQIRAVRDALLKADTTGAKALADRLTPIEEAIYQTKLRSGQDALNYPIRLNDRLAGVLSAVLGGEGRPTRQSYTVYGRLSRDLQTQLDALKTLLGPELTRVNAELKASGKPEVTVPKDWPPSDSSRRRGGTEGA